MARDLIVDETYISEKTDALRKAMNTTDEVLTQYVAILEHLSATAIQKGATAEVLRLFIEMAKDLKGDLTQIAELTVTIGGNYLKDIDSADRYLY